MSMTTVNESRDNAAGCCKRVSSAATSSTTTYCELLATPVEPPSEDSPRKRLTASASVRLSSRSCRGRFNTFFFFLRCQGEFCDQGADAGWLLMSGRGAAGCRGTSSAAGCRGTSSRFFFFLMTRLTFFFGAAGCRPTLLCSRGSSWTGVLVCPPCRPDQRTLNCDGGIETKRSLWG